MLLQSDLSLIPKHGLIFGEKSSEDKQPSQTDRDFQFFHLWLTDAWPICDRRKWGWSWQNRSRVRVSNIDRLFYSRPVIFLTLYQMLEFWHLFWTLTQVIYQEVTPPTPDLSSFFTSRKYFIILLFFSLLFIRLWTFFMVLFYRFLWFSSHTFIISSDRHGRGCVS